MTVANGGWGVNGNPVRVATQNRLPAAQTSQTKRHRPFINMKRLEAPAVLVRPHSGSFLARKNGGVCRLAAHLLTSADLWDRGDSRDSSRGCYLTGNSRFKRPDNHTQMILKGAPLKNTAL